MSLSWDLHNCFSAFFPLLGETRGLEGDEIGKMSFPQRDKALTHSYPWKIGICCGKKLCVYFIRFTLSFLLLKPQRDISQIMTIRIWWGSWRKNPWNWFLRLDPQEFLTLMLVYNQFPSNSSELLFEYCYQVMAPVSSTTDNQIAAVTLWIHLSSSLISSWKVADFQSVQLFVVIRTGVMTSKLCSCQNWDRKSFGGFLLIHAFCIFLLLSLYYCCYYFFLSQTFGSFLWTPFLSLFLRCL